MGVFYNNLINVVAFLGVNHKFPVVIVVADFNRKTAFLSVIPPDVPYIDVGFAFTQVGELEFKLWVVELHVGLLPDAGQHGDVQVECVQTLLEFTHVPAGAHELHLGVRDGNQFKQARHVHILPLLTVTFTEFALIV